MVGLVVGGFTFGGSWALYKFTNRLVIMRVNAENEDDGLDASQHGESIITEQLALSAR